MSDVNDIVAMHKQISKKRMKEVRKKLLLSSHKPGDPCNCKRWECFEHVTIIERNELLKTFNNLPNINEQNIYLSSLITLLPVKRRRPRPEAEHLNRSVFHGCSFKFIVKVLRNNEIIEIPVCRKAFMSIHGISSGKIEYIQKSLRLTGKPPKDKRGSHNNHERNKEAKLKIIDHVKSFKGKESIDNGSKILYLSPKLNIKKMFTSFIKLNPELDVTYEYYRTTSKKQYKLVFGDPNS